VCSRSSPSTVSHFWAENQAATRCDFDGNLAEKIGGETHQDHVWRRAALGQPAVQVRIHRIDVLQVVAQHRIARVQYAAQVGAGELVAVVAAQVRRARHLHIGGFCTVGIEGCAQFASCSV